MNSNQFQNSEPNSNPVINPFLSANISFLQNQNLNRTNLNQNQQLFNIIQEKQEKIKDQNATKIMDQTGNEINSIPFKSLMTEEESKITNIPSNINNKFTTIVNNSFSNNIGKVNNTPIITNININRNSSYKIQLFKSPIKSEEKASSKNETIENNVQIINLNHNKNKNENYKKLIKRIAIQLKKRIKKPTKGFFYKYINQENEKQYKILIKKIATQLKKRIKFPTSKIIKIYESYIILIKRIAYALKTSINKRKNEIQNMEEKKENDIDLNMDIIEEDKNEVVKKSKSKNSKNSKNIKIDMTLLKKNDTENDMKLAEDNIMNIINENNQELNQNHDTNINLSNFEISKSNFVNNFKSFLDKSNISLVNNLPVSLHEKNKIYFQQSNFWILIINYILYQNSNLPIYTLLYLLDQYFIWCKDKNIENFSSIKLIIKEYITKNYNPEKINEFLFMNKLNNIDDIFIRFEQSIKNENQKNDYKEIKIDEININNNNICNCDLCKNENACVKKVLDINKEKVKIIKDQNFDFICNKEINKNNEINIENNSELYFKGLSNKKNNKIFTESKTRFTENTNFVYTGIINTNIINKDNNESDEKNKSFKNVSKRKMKSSDKKESTEKKIDEVKKEEKKESTEKKIEEDKEEKEEITKNKKRGRKQKKEKSRNKNNKKDTSLIDKSEEVIEKEIEEEFKKDIEKENEEKQKKKKKSRKLNKSEISDENEEKYEKDEQKQKNKKKSRTKGNKKSKKNEELEDINSGDDADDEKSLNNSRRLKSKTPKNKKSRKNNKK